MGNLVITPKETAIFSDNLLTDFYDFTTPTSFTIVSGGSNASLNEVTNLKYSSSLSLKVTQLIVNSDLVFDKSGNTTNAPRAGKYILSTRLFVASDDDDCEISLKVQAYVNDVLLPANDFEAVINSTNGFIYDNWNTFAQTFDLAFDDRVDLRFICQSDKVGSEIFIDGLKLELNDRNLNAPTTYSKPI